MKTLYYVIMAALILLVTAVPAHAQGSSSLERKAFREFTSPQELVSLAPTTSLDRALSIISEVSKRFTGKIIIDTERRSAPINIDIQGMHWRDALEAICRKNDLWYTEYETYIQITSSGGGNGQAAAGGPQGPYNGEIPKEYATLKSREVKISAFILDANLTRLDEVGLNWDFMKSTKDYTVSAQMRGVQKLSDKMFGVEVTPKLSFANIDVLASMFSNYSLGEILAGPQVIVRSGEQGRIQVGQDFSVRERDFAGNLIDKFYSAGTIVTVTPQVLTEQGVSFIHMKVEVERSDVQPTALTTLVNRTKANTNLLLLDGEESVIGGLYSKETSTVRSGVPFLKDLPWYVFGLKYIFGYDKEQDNRRELVILLKAELVPTLQERITQKKKEDGVMNRWIQEQQRMEQHLKPNGK